MPSSLQLNLFVPQPDPLTKEQLFSEEKRKELRKALSNTKYNFHKANTRFVSYEELLKKIAQMKDWLKENINNWNKTAFIVSDSSTVKSNHWITEHYYNNIDLKVVNYGNSENNTYKDYETLIIADDGLYTGDQVDGAIRDILESSKKTKRIVLAIPYISVYGLFVIKKLLLDYPNCEIIYPNKITDTIHCMYTGIVKGYAKIIYNEEDFMRELGRLIDDYYSVPLIFQHKKADTRSIPHIINNITRDIKPPYK